MATKSASYQFAASAAKVGCPLSLLAYGILWQVQNTSKPRQHFVHLSEPDLNVSSFRLLAVLLFCGSMRGHATGVVAEPLAPMG